MVPEFLGGKGAAETIVIRFGVPQGSVLGPVLFNLYLRSIYNCVQKLNFNIFGYADDHQITKVFHPMQQGDVLTVQLVNCFTVIKRWMQSYYLQLNSTKTQIIVFGPARILDEVLIGGVNISPGANIRFVSSVRNLGVQMDNMLTFDAHVTNLKKKCFHILFGTFVSWVSFSAKNN